MTRRLVALALALGLGAVAAPAQAQEELTNVITLPRTGTDLVTIRVMFLTGSIADPKGKEGLTALTARLMAAPRRFRLPSSARRSSP